MTSGVIAVIFYLAASALTSEPRITSPSVDPISGSAARSGCGIMPSTLRSRFRMPAMLRMDPLQGVDVAEGDAILGFELVERAVVGVVVAFAVGDRHGQHLPFLAPCVNGEFVVSTRNLDGLADEFQSRVAQQRAGQQAAFAEDLEAVADAQHEPAIGGELLDSLHHRRELGDRSAAQVVAVGEAAGQDDSIDIAELLRVVPDEFRLLTEILRDGVQSVVIAIAAGKNDNAKFHGEIPV